MQSSVEEAAQRSRSARANRRRTDELAALLRVRERLSQIGVNSPPNDVAQLAVRLGITHVEFVPLHVKARLFQDTKGLAIQLREDLAPWEANFAIAHELGHLLLEEDRFEACQLGVGASPRTQQDYAKTERLCDLAAEEILLPERWLSNNAPDNRPSLDFMFALARKTGWGIDLVLRRVHNVLWRDLCRIVWWTGRDSSVRAIRANPEWSSLELDMLTLVPDPKSPLYACLLDDSKHAVGSMMIDFGDQRINYRAECRCLPTGEVVSLLNYSGAPM